MQRFVIGLLAMFGSAALLAAAHGGAQAPPSQHTSLTGVVKAQGNKYILTDETSKVRYELQGSGLKKFRNMRVSVQGKAAQQTTEALAPRVFHVASIHAAVGAAAGGAAAGGVSTGVIVGAGAAAAAGGTVGGLYAAGAIGGSNEKPASPQ